ncbi:hypothetical protein [Proteus cibi]|uniref:hypothetical protein n=1 Tax=Proteus cibi TaxID=2050966 RepID=UPI0035A6B24F
MKRNIDDFNGMKDFIISIVTVIAWVLIGVIIAIGYFTMETKGESVIISFVSMIFTMVSSLGILATIGVYFWQRNDNERKQFYFDKKIAPLIISKAYKITKRINKLIRLINEIDRYIITINHRDIEYISKNNESLPEGFRENKKSISFNLENDEINENKIGLSYELYHFATKLDKNILFILLLTSSHLNAEYSDDILSQYLRGEGKNIEERKLLIKNLKEARDDIFYKLLEFSDKYNVTEDEINSTYEE